MIVDDNNRSGVRQQIPAPESIPPLRRSPHSSKRPLSVPDASSFGPTNEVHTGTPRYSSPLPKLERRPSVRDQSYPERDSSALNQRPAKPSKPEALQRRPKTPTNAPIPSSDNAIEERFSRLRVNHDPTPAESEVYSLRNGDHSTTNRSSPTQYAASFSEYSPPQNFEIVSTQGFSPGRPIGPRAMPPPPPLHPPHPPKIPLDAPLALSLPRAPSPAYNPSGTIPPLNRKRSIVGMEAIAISPSAGTSALRPLSKTSTNSRKTSRDFNGDSSSSYVDLPQVTSLKAEELYERLQEYNVLVIDVRRREEFDRGHISANSVMCIEPLDLRQGVSAEQLEDSLVVSPATELALFERRDFFDLVVYYDQKTSSDRFLSGPPPSNEGRALRALHDTLYEFNAYKPLRLPPAILIGGLDSWVALVGFPALQTSDTAGLISSKNNRASVTRHGRPISRVPMASSNSTLEVRKKRLRDYQPLDAEEDKTWRERTRQEEAETSNYHDSDEEEEPDFSQSNPAVVHTIEEFFKKYPEPSAIRQSMMIPAPPPPSRSPPVLPENIPSRPPPAVPRPSYSGVSERESQISTSSRQPSYASPPLYTSRISSRFLKLPRTGMINFSVTCYMNATIQCLLATIPLSEFFLSNRWRAYVQNNFKGSNGIMPGIFANLIRSLWRGESDAIRPISLRKFSARLNPEWGVDRQQDAKEYIDFLLDCLHEDLNYNWQKTPLTSLTPGEERRRESMPISKVSRLEWERYSHREASFISSLFAGQHASRLRCRTCNNTSTTYEAFYSISIEIPSRGRADIHKCLSSYCKEEMLSGDEVWRCSYCNCEREATKRIIITRAPQFLVIHFKRFSASKTQSVRKVHTQIDFPLHGLNMEPYIFSSRDPQISGENDPAITPPFIYDAYAVMRHLGSSGNGGHYVSLCKDTARGCWRKFDDDRVSDFDPARLRTSDRLQNEDAYLVFYGRAVAR